MMIFVLILNEYLENAQARLPEKSARVLRILNDEGPCNKESLSLAARVLMMLYALGLVEIETEGKSMICNLTQLGIDFLEIIKEEKK